MHIGVRSIQLETLICIHSYEAVCGNMYKHHVCMLHVYVCMHLMYACMFAYMFACIHA